MSIMHSYFYVYKCLRLLLVVAVAVRVHYFANSYEISYISRSKQVVSTLILYLLTTSKSSYSSWMKRKYH